MTIAGATAAGTMRAMSCPHRGEYIREVDCKACGIRGKTADVIECDLHGECTLHVTGHKIRACATCTDRPRRIVVNADAHGFGDAVTTAWASEASKGQPVELIHYATGAKRELLELLGQTVTDDPTGAVTTFAAYSQELQQRGRVPRVVQRAKALGVDAAPTRPGPVTIPDAAKQWAAEIAASRRASGAGGFVLLFPETAYLSRLWPAACWVDLAWMLERSGIPAVVMLGARDDRFTNVPAFQFGHSWINVAALMLAADVVVSNDSGPAHVAGTLDVPTLAVLGPTTPAIFSHMPSVKTIAASSSEISCVGCYFGLPYRAACDQTCQALMRVSPQQVAERIAEMVAAKLQRRPVKIELFAMQTSRKPMSTSGPAPTPSVNVAGPETLVPFRDGTMVRTGYRHHQDLDVWSEVIGTDCYRTALRGHAGAGEVVVDVGAHIGCFARLWHAKNPAAKIVCVEVCPENLDALKANVGGFADIVNAACTYHPGEIGLLNSVFPAGSQRGTATGGSRVVTQAELMSQGTFGHLYWRDVRPLEKITLEEIQSRLGVDRIDVLKLDCEGSEFDILEHCDRSRLRMVFGEYHGWKRFDEMRRRLFAGWDFGHMHGSTADDGLGIFHLVNPAGAP